MPLVSLRKYAAHRRVSHTAVQKAIKQGRIKTTPDGKIDVEQADQEWDRNTEPPAVARKQPPELSVSRGSPPGPSYAQSRAVRELYLARLAKLEYEEQSGKLVSLDEVIEELSQHLHMVRQRLVSIPDRLTEAIAAETDSDKVHGILAQEIEDALTEICRYVEAAGATSS